MALVKRLSNLLTADVHAVLDLMEDPLVLIKQAIREMQQAIDTQQSSLQALNNAIEKSAYTRQQHLLEQDRINKDIDLCFDSENSSNLVSQTENKQKQNLSDSSLTGKHNTASNALIRRLLKSRIVLEKQIRTLENEAEILKQRRQSLIAQIQQNQEKLESMRQQSQELQRQSQFNQATATSTTPLNVNYGSCEVSDEEIELALLNEQQARTKQ